MKPSALFFAGSLLANCALVGLFAFKPTLAPAAFRSFFGSTSASAENSTTASPKPAPRATRANASPAQLWSTLKSDDLPSLITRLRAAGFPPDIVRAVVSSMVSEPYRARIAELNAPDPNVPYWKTTSNYGPTDAKRREELNQLYREQSKLQRELFKDDFFATGDVTTAQRRQFGNLSRNKIDALQRIEDDYSEMFSQVNSSAGGFTLPIDREKLALLAREKQADIAAVLTPEELADYTMRSSPITSLVRSQLSVFNPNEAEFRAIFDSQKFLNERMQVTSNGGMISFGDGRQQQAAQAEAATQLKAALGEARYAEYERSVDSTYQQLTRLVQRDNLPADTALQAFNVRDSVAQESTRIFNDPALATDQKRDALKTLASNTRSQLLSMLGPTSGPAYVKLADQAWLSQVEQGAAFKLEAGMGGMSILSSNNGVTTMISLGGRSPMFNRVPPTTPPPPRN